MSIQQSTQFPAISMQKFALLFFSTMGLYSLYWIYRNWIAYEQETGRKVFRLGRTLFAMFFVHEMFAQIERKNRANESPYKWSPSAKAWLFITAGILELVLFYIGAWYAWHGPFYSFITLIITRLVYLYALYTAQLVINRNAGDPFGKSNGKLTVGNQVAIVLGLYLWFNLLHGIYLQLTGQLPEPDPLMPPEVSQPMDMLDYPQN